MYDKELCDTVQFGSGWGTVGGCSQHLSLLPSDIPVDAEGVQPVQGQREAHHCDQHRYGRHKITQRGRAG